MRKLLVALILIPAFAMADFAIDDKATPAQQPTKKEIAGSDSKVLLLDSATKYLVEKGTGVAGKLPGASTTLSLAKAMPFILPSGWKAYGQNGLDFSSVSVTWADGETWTSVLERVARQNGLSVVVDWPAKEVIINKAPDMGYFAKDSGSSSFTNLNLSDSEATKGVESSSYVTTKNEARNQSVTNSSAEPNDKETINSYAERFASINGYDRVAYKIKASISKTISNEIDPAGARKSKTPFSFDAALKKNGLYKVDGTDAVSGSRVLVIADKEYAQGSTLLVFGIAKGMLSHNAETLARIVGKEIGGLNCLVSDEDYEIPFGYDIVGSTAIDMFTEMFAPFPIQAQFVVGQKTINIVKRDTANREH
jgi:hypothetical protein